MMNSSFESEVLHTPYELADPHNALSMPIYHCAAYEFSSAEEMEDAFLGKNARHTYSRISNPSVQHFEQQIKNITGAFSVTALNSGMAAITNVVFELAYAGANIVTTDRLFGNTFSFFKSTIEAFGVQARFCDLTDLEAVEKNIDADTCMIFGEIITNPQQVVIDLQALAALAHKYNIPFVADTTIIPPHLLKSKNFGVDIEVLSSTKYISGGGTSVGGLIVDNGIFDWSHSKRLASLAEKFGKSAFTEKLRKEIHRNLGAYMTPHSAYMQSLGLATLPLRYEKQTQTCADLARELQKIPAIVSVNYTGLKENPFYELSTRQFGKNPGAMLTFDLASKQACFSFLNRLKRIHRATNLFDTRSLAIHPASTIFGNFSLEQRQAMDVRETTIRLSVGLEAKEELLNDILQALNEKD